MRLVLGRFEAGKVFKNRFYCTGSSVFTIFSPYIAFLSLRSMPYTCLLVDFWQGAKVAKIMKITKSSKTPPNMSRKVPWGLGRRYKWIKRPFGKNTRFRFFDPLNYVISWVLSTLQRMTFLKKCQICRRKKSARWPDLKTFPWPNRVVLWGFCYAHGLYQTPRGIVDRPTGRF